MLRVSKILTASSEIECWGCHTVFPQSSLGSGKCPKCREVWTNVPQVKGFDPLPKMILKTATTEFPIAPAVLDGLQVGSKVNNMGSIASTYSREDYRVLEGIRSIPMTAVDSDPRHLFYAKNDFDHARRLAEEINTNGRIDPLILVVDPEGPYILEGAHRLGALHMLGKTHFPALVVEADV